MKNIKNSKAITLIALVITIIVLLILAGVVINLTIGENGIFKIAKHAAKKYTDAEQDEKNNLGELLAEANNIINGTDSNNNELPYGTIIKTQDNINYTADGVGNIIPVPVGFSPMTGDSKGTKNTGFVIKNDIDGNEFVWVPVDSKTPYQYAIVPFARTGWKFNQNLVNQTTIIVNNGDSTTSTYTEIIPIIENGRTELDSVEEYGGYYIGRYEAGILSTTERTRESETEDFVVQKRKNCI